MAHYETYTTESGKVIVVSHYAGKAVRGVAKCSPADTFDKEKGEELARLRCDSKIAAKRVARAKVALDAARKVHAEAYNKVSAMEQYLNDALLLQGQANKDLAQLTEAL